MKSRFRKNIVGFGIVFLMTMVFVEKGRSQAENPVKWVVTTSQEDGKAIVEFKAIIDDGWHLYALELPSDEGPIPTEVVFTDSKSYTLIGGVKQEEPHSSYDPNFDMDILYFEGETVFRQELKLISDQVEVSGYITFMVCNDERCLPPVDHEFKVTIE